MTPVGHLSDAELLDLAEGVRPESSVPHLVACERCRHELSSLRGVMTETACVQVPEPSPLFWDYLSARVQDAVAAETPAYSAADDGLRRFRPNALRARAILWSAAAAIAVLAIAVGVRAPWRSSQPRVSFGGADVPLNAVPSDDPALSLVAQMAGALDEEAAGALAPADITAHPGVVEESVNGMSQGEREELGRLINEEMRHAGP